MISRDEVQKLATLSRIDLEEHELETISHQFTEILDYVARIGQAVEEAGVKTDVSIPQGSPALAPINVLREDTEARPGGEYSHDLVNAAPAHDESYVQVKHMF